MAEARALAAELARKRRSRCSTSSRRCIAASRCRSTRAVPRGHALRPGGVHRGHARRDEGVSREAEAGVQGQMSELRGSLSAPAAASRSSCPASTRRSPTGCSKGARGAGGGRCARTTSPSCTCPGAFELPVAALRVAETGRFDAVICLGCLIKGDTMHFEYIAEQRRQASWTSHRHRRARSRSAC